jgi:hypothetical protein
VELNALLPLSPKHLRDEMTRTERSETLRIDPDTAVGMSAGTAQEASQEGHKNQQEHSKTLRVSGNLS